LSGFLLSLVVIVVVVVVGAGLRVVDADAGVDVVLGTSVVVVGPAVAGFLVIIPIGLLVPLSPITGLLMPSELPMGRWFVEPPPRPHPQLFFWQAFDLQNGLVRQAPGHNTIAATLTTTTGPNFQAATSSTKKKTTRGCLRRRQRPEPAAAAAARLLLADIRCSATAASALVLLLPNFISAGVALFMLLLGCCSRSTTTSRATRGCAVLWCVAAGIADHNGVF